MTKVVSFDDVLVYHEMWSADDYDRSQVKNLLHKRGYNRITSAIWQRIIKDLEFFKVKEMSIHIDNVDLFKV